MLRFLTGAGSATLLLLAGFFIWKGVANRSENPVPAAPAPTEAAADVPLTPGRPPSADSRTREQRRFDRADRDNDGKIVMSELLDPRRKSYAKLDKDGDGKLSFEEWAHTTIDKFRGADGNRDSLLTRAEYATTAPPPRKPKPKCGC